MNGLKRLGLGILGCSIWALGLTLTPAMGQSMPRIRPGIAYPQIRQELINRGWMLVPNSELARNPRNNLEKYLFKQGYIELMGCTNAGVDLCAFKFVNRRGHTLEISTVHLSVTLDGTIQAWARRKPAK